MLLLYFIFSAVCAAIVLLHKNERLTQILACAFLVSQSVLCIYGITHIGETSLGYFKFDALGVIFLSVLSILSFASIFHGFIYTKDDHSVRYFYYHSSIILFITAITGAYLASDLTVLWIFAEATTLSSAILIYHHRTPHALEATWKYVFVCTIGIAIAYMGILFLSTTLKMGVGDQMSFINLRKSFPMANPMLLKMAFLLVLVGFSTKMELFPMHTVGIDANTIAPPQVGALMSSALVNMGFLCIFRVYHELETTSIAPWMHHVLTISGIGSLLVAAAYMLKAHNFKRMFAYSTVENMGIVAIALGCGRVGFAAAIIHLVFHSFTKASLFYQARQIHDVYGTYEIQQTGNYFNLYPIGALVMLLGLVGIAAIPPSGLFVSEFMVFKTLISERVWWLAIPAFALLTFVLYGLTNRVLHLIFANTQIIPSKTPNPLRTISQFVLLGIVVTACFYKADFFYQLVLEAVK